MGMTGNLNVRLSENFALRELIKSNTADRLGIDNTPSNLIIHNLRELCMGVLQPVRDNYGVPIMPSSGYRCLDLERVICARTIHLIHNKGGDKEVEKYLRRKQHPKGEAVDFEVPGVSNLILAKWVRDNLMFDQLILEFYDVEPNSGWVHTSLRALANRGQVLVYHKNGAVSSGFPEI